MGAFERMVGDVEVYPNLFTFYAIDYDSEEERAFEISERKNDLASFCQFMRSIKYFIGFNIMHYDNIIIMFLLKNERELSKLPVADITRMLKELNDTVILDNDGSQFRRYSKYKWNQPYISIDLFLYWSKMLRISKKLSLKSLAVNINWPRIQELPLPIDHIVKLDEIDYILSYNSNDTKVTKSLAKDHLQKEINLRADAKRKYGFECLSWDGVKLGLHILVHRYSQRINKPVAEINQLRSPRESINIGSLLLPCIHFDEADDTYIQFIENKALVTQFKSFYGLHKYLSNLTVTTTKQINCQVLYEGNRYDVKSGGLHTYHTGAVIRPGKGVRYRDKDVSSYYPTLGAMWGFIPEHLGKEFAEELDAIRHDRLTLKANGQGKSNDANLLKLAMNGGFYGNTNSEYTPMFDPKCMLSITMNGQLMLLMLCEWLMKIGVTIDMCNTDGVTLIYDEELEGEVERISKVWEEMTKMELESVDYKTVARRDINNYLAIYEEKGEIKTKEKGMFMTEPEIDKSRDFLVIAKALKAYYKDGVPVEEFIRGHSDIYDFCAAQKVDKKYTVMWNGQKQQRLNRYYVCKTGPYLYKQSETPKGTKIDNMMKGWSVQLFNDYFEKPMNEYNINYAFYIAETKKVLEELESSRLKMF